MTFRYRLTTRQREELYLREAEKARAADRGEYPICALCDQVIQPGSAWDESHNKHQPHWLGGQTDGISHRRCNRIWNNTHDTPLFAKSERTRKRHLDFTRSRSPLPGGRDDTIKKTVRGEVVKRS